MSGLGITHSGAYGDCLYEVPALNILRSHFGYICHIGRPQAEQALGNTALIDEFITWPKDYKKWDVDYTRQWLSYQTQHIEIDAHVNLHRIIPGRLMFHDTDPKYHMPTVCKRAMNAGKNHFDEVTMRFQETLDIDLSEAIGQRPITKLTHKERSWLRDFRFQHSVPKDAFMLGYQFAGSARHKWYPYFEQAIQRGIMQRYPEVYVVGLGDLDGEMDWPHKYHGGRYVNLKGSITFREAYILTSIMDLLISPQTGVFVGAQAYETPKILLATHMLDETVCGDETIMLTPESECAPCYNIVHTCDIDESINAPLCAASIHPDRVIMAAGEIIERKRRINALRIQPLVIAKSLPLRESVR